MPHTDPERGKFRKFLLGHARRDFNDDIKKFYRRRRLETETQDEADFELEELQAETEAERQDSARFPSSSSEVLCR